MRQIGMLLIAISLAGTSVFGQRYLGHRPTDSGTPLSPEQLAYDVRFYELNLTVMPNDKRIAGNAQVAVDVVHPMTWLVLDLDRRMEVSKVEIRNASGDYEQTRFERMGDKVRVYLSGTRQPGAAVTAKIHYAGHPLEAPAPPWVGGFTWSQTLGGSPWIATSVQLDGSDLWWPCKDHPSDEADSVAINITIPPGLELASNGVLRGIDTRRDGHRTFRWFVGNPINNYNVALNIAPYRKLEGVYDSVTGEEIPVTFWVLPEHQEQGEAVFPQFFQHLAFYERVLGPYPFRSEKYGVAETPHLGMEHQTIIAYGRFANNEFGFDELHHHELGHEWWGNLVSAYDWRDFWLQEGFCAYMQALYAEELKGQAAYHQYFVKRRTSVRNLSTLAPRETQSTNQRYFVAPEYVASDGDIYTKGALFLHALRFLIGKDHLLLGLRRFAYPTPEAERRTDGSQCRFATTDDFLLLLEEIAGMDLDWVFEVYARQPALPELVTEVDGDRVTLRWETPEDLPFPMPVEVGVDDELRRVEMPGGQATIAAPGGRVEVDPNNWIFRKGNWRNSVLNRKSKND